MTREEAKEILKHVLTSGETGYNYFMTYEDVEAIKALAEDRWGKWVVSEVRCPNCLEYFDTDCYSKEEMRRCPNCGASMRKEGDEK